MRILPSHVKTQTHLQFETKGKSIKQNTKNLGNKIRRFFLGEPVPMSTYLPPDKTFIERSPSWLKIRLREVTVNLAAERITKRLGLQRSLDDLDRHVALGASPRLLAWRGTARRLLGRADALDDFNLVLAQEPNYPFAQLGRASAYLQQSPPDLVRARADISAVLRYAPRSVHAIMVNAVAFHLEGNNEQALAWFGRSAELRPCNDWAMAGIALLSPNPAFVKISAQAIGGIMPVNWIANAIRDKQLGFPSLYPENMDPPPDGTKVISVLEAPLWLYDRERPIGH